MEKKTITYKDAGVDIDKGNASVELIKPYVKATRRPEVIGGLGGFGGLFAFDKDEEISTHESGGDAFVTCLDGVGRITIDGKDYELCEGESIVMPAGHPHAVYGKDKFKMLLVVVF